jgi:hypothetical protein
MVGATDRKSVGWLFELTERVRITVKGGQLGEGSGRIVLELNAQRSRMGHPPDYSSRIQLFTDIENSGKCRIQEGVDKVQRLNDSDKVRRRPVAATQARLSPSLNDAPAGERQCPCQLELSSATDSPDQFHTCSRLRLFFHAQGGQRAFVCSKCVGFRFLQLQALLSHERSLKNPHGCGCTVWCVTRS